MIVMTVMMLVMVMLTVQFCYLNALHRWVIGLRKHASRHKNTRTLTHTHIYAPAHRTKGDQVTSELLDAMLHTHSTTHTHTRVLPLTQAINSSNFNFYAGICDFIAVFLLNIVSSGWNQHCAVAIEYAFERQCLQLVCMCPKLHLCISVYSVTWECSLKHSMVVGCSFVSSSSSFFIFHSQAQKFFAHFFSFWFFFSLDRSCINLQQDEERDTDSDDFFFSKKRREKIKFCIIHKYAVSTYISAVYRWNETTLQ